MKYHKIHVVGGGAFNNIGSINLYIVKSRFTKSL